MARRSTLTPTGSGYSGTPLPRKLGIAPDTTVAVIGRTVAAYRALVAPLPGSVRLVARPVAEAAITHLFVTRARVLPGRLGALRSLMRDDAAIWVSWPKRSSGVETDVTEDTIRAAALPLGLVDVKVCSVDAVWSGLKFVVRRALRARHVRRG
jgi:hypothetical protein